MRTRWQKLMKGMVLGLILALAAGQAVWAKKKKAPESTSENAPGPAAPAEATPSAPGPAEAAPTPAPAEAAPEPPSFEVETPAVTAPAVPAPPPGQPQYRLHKVGKDENLHLLAAYYYGDARQWTRIYNLNKKTIRNPNLLQEGQMLRIEVPAGWQPRFNLPEFMDKEHKRIANQGMRLQAKPQVIHETQKIQVIPRLLPADEEEGATEGKTNAGEGKVNIPSTGETPGVSVPTQTPASPLTPESGGTTEK